MLGAIFSSLSGMNAFTKGLTIISNNVGNMNTAGFKLTDARFSDLVFHYGGTLGNGNSSSQTSGAGVTVDQSLSSLQQGDLRETGNNLDAAIDGSGLFVVDQDGNRQYTRAGQFEFNKDGILVERITGARVMVSTDTNAIGSFDLNTVRIFEPRATTEVKLSGTLQRFAAGATGTAYSLPQIKVVDTTGTTVLLTAKLTPDNSDPLHWTVDILDDKNVVQGSGDVRFNDNGTPATDGSAFTVTIKPPTGATFDVSFNFGAPSTYAGVTSIAGGATNTQPQASSLQVLKQNGAELGVITKTEFTDNGELKITYSNGETRTPAKLIIAQFDAPEQLRALGGSHFAAVGTQEPSMGSALTSGKGRVVGGQLEMSNVDLTNQFSELIITQRGFQGCSQITTVANEMMQQLLSMNGKG